MSGPSAQAPHATGVRPPAVAGLFYPDDDEACAEMARRFVEGANVGPARAMGQGRLLGAIVPHAGWVCSGAIAGMSIGALAQSRADVDVVVVFGAIHTPLDTDVALFDPHGRWHVPGGGDVQISEDFQAKVGEAGPSLFATDERFHRREHAVEVELPLIRQAWPNARVLPIELPALEQAVEMGLRTARVIAASGAGDRAVFLASSDLTHYGPAYDFAPMGVGLEGLAWAKQNDRRLLDLVARMRIDQIVPEARDRLNACGAGAIAAMLAACRELGATEAHVLHHASSYQTLAEVHPQPPDNAVGYASVVVG